MVLGSLLTLGATSFTALMPSIVRDYKPAAGLSDVFSNASKRSEYRYQTDLTRNVAPRPIHSHDDFWRDVPVYSSIAAGAISIEADVWYFPKLVANAASSSNASAAQQLFIGRQRSSLSPERTFDSLYVQPLLEILTRQNPMNRLTADDGAKPTKNGVFDMDVNQMLYLLVDIKSDGASTWPMVVRAIEPLRAAGYLTTYNGSAMVPGPLTVVGTGNMMRGFVPEGPVVRDAFWDAPLNLLSKPDMANVTSDVSPIASAGWLQLFMSADTEAGRKTSRTGLLDATQTANLTEMLSVAHSRGIKTRFRQTPAWPAKTRNLVWETLVEAGSDLLNVDDLDAALSLWQ